MRAFLSILCISGCTAGATVLDRLDGGAALDSGMANDSGSSVAADSGGSPIVDSGSRDAGTPSCVGRDDVGSVEGLTPLGRFRFPYVAAGIEQSGGHSCPRLFLRAGNDPTFSGDHIEIEASYTRGEPIVPGLRPGRARIFMGDDVWTEESFEVDVQRADGLIDLSPPMDSWRARAEIRHHRALVDIVAVIHEATYCYDFPLCL